MDAAEGAFVTVKQVASGLHPQSHGVQVLKRSMKMELAAFRQAEQGLRTSLVGELESWSVYDILTWLDQSRRSAMLTVGEGVRSSKVFVRHGQVFRVEHQGECGERGLFGLLQVTSGPFQLLLRAPPDARPNILCQTDELLLKCAAAVDEHNSIVRAQAAG